MKQNLRSVGTRGQILSNVTGVVTGLALLIFVVFAFLYGLSALNPGTFFTAGSASQNATNQAVANYTTGIATFFNQVPTAMNILGVVLILAFVGILLSVVMRYRDSAGAGSL